MGCTFKIDCPFELSCQIWHPIYWWEISKKHHKSIPSTQNTVHGPHYNIIIVVIVVLLLLLIKFSFYNGHWTLRFNPSPGPPKVWCLLRHQCAIPTTPLLPLVKGDSKAFVLGKWNAKWIYMGKTLPCIKTKHNLGKQKGTSGKSKNMEIQRKTAETQARAVTRGIDINWNKTTCFRSVSIHSLSSPTPPLAPTRSRLAPQLSADSRWRPTVAAHLQCIAGVWTMLRHSYAAQFT